MRQTAPAGRPTRRTLRPTVVNLVVVTAAICGTLVYRSASSATSSFSETASPGAPHAVPRSAPSSAPSFRGVLPGDLGGAAPWADGAVPDGVTVFDDEYPGVANLDPDLLAAVRRAATDAADDGVEFIVESGWRSSDYQERLLQQAISTYGSRKEAARWVATPETSAHVTGDAIDIGHVDARTWLSTHGAAYGLCQIYRNEPWHYELRPKAIGRGCPRMYADPAHDPRMRQ